MSAPAQLFLRSSLLALYAVVVLVIDGRGYGQTPPSEANEPPLSEKMEAEAGQLQRTAQPQPSTKEMDDGEESKPSQLDFGASANHSPTFELDIGASQEIGPEAADKSGDDALGRGELGGEGGQENSNGTANQGGGDTAGSGSSVGTGTGGTGESGTGQPGEGSGSGFGDGNGTGDGNGPRRTRTDYIPNMTGLIVDARQLDFLPSMSMRLFDRDGNQVYTTPETNRQLNTSQVSINGTASFVTSEDEARQLIGRIGERPHTIKAERTQGYDLVISNSDAWELRNQNQRDRFLDNYAVVVIWSPQTSIE